MKAYKLEILVLDHEGIGLDEIRSLIENAKYVYPSIIKVQEAEIGEWDDDHPLNSRETAQKACEELFPSEHPDKKRMDWLETQDCWVGICGDYYAEPISQCGGCYQASVRGVCDKGVQ